MRVFKFGFTFLSVLFLVACSSTQSSNGSNSGDNDKPAPIFTNFIFPKYRAAPQKSQPPQKINAEQSIQKTPITIEQAYSHFNAEEYQKANYALDDILVKSPDDTKALELRNLMKEKADSHYKSGIRCYLNEEFSCSEIELTRTLQLDPTNQRAVNDLDKVKRIIQRLEELK